MRLKGYRMYDIILKYVIISHVLFVVKGCILLLNGWTPISVSERTALADIVVSGYVIETYKHVRTKAMTYSAKIEIMNVFKGNIQIQEIDSIDKNIYMISNFGDKKMCYADISQEETYIFFLTVYKKRLSAQYDDIFGAVVEFTRYNEDEVIKKLGWDLWSSWGSCSRSCNSGVQVRRRTCRKQNGTCNGEDVDKRQCNTFTCKGIRDLLETFGASKLPVGVTRDQIRPFSYNISDIASLYAPLSSVFRNVFPNDFSIIMTVQIKKKKSGYLFSLSDIMGKQRMAIKHGDRIILEYYDQNNLPGKKSPSFDFKLNDGNWHQVAISVRNREIKLYFDCQNVKSKYFGRSENPSLGTNLMLSVGPYFARYGSPFEGHLEQLVIIPDPDSAAKQCSEQSSLTEQAIKDEGDVKQDTVTQPAAHPVTPKHKVVQTTPKTENKVTELSKKTSNSNWSKWTACSVSCGRGIQSRTRYCRNKVVNNCLKGRKKTVQRRACVIKDCKVSCPKCVNGGKCNINGTCTCRTGYSGTECEKVTCESVCTNGGSCIGPNTCACASGFTGKTCDSEMCPQKCRNGGRCVKPGVCSCPYGFLPPFCKPVCTATCHNGGRCVRRNMCKCRRGYTGKDCTTPVCRRGCHNGGKCVAPNMCSCLRGYRGRRCHKAVCRPKCKNNGKCVYPNVCNCKRGFYGVKCEKYKCKRTCKNGGFCVGPNKCQCVNGYSGKWCHLGKCREACLHGGKCKNNRCRCPPGWRGNRCQYRGCTYEKYVVPYDRSYKKMNREEYTTKCGPWSWKTCVKTRVRYELVYKTMYRTAYRCV